MWPLTSRGGNWVKLANQLWFFMKWSAPWIILSIAASPTSLLRFSNRLLPAIFRFAYLHLAFFLSWYNSVFASSIICTVAQSLSLFAVISALSDLKSSTFGLPMISSSIFMHLFFVIAFILSVNAQSTTLSTVRSPTTTTSESASSSFSSQIVWSEKSWDVIVVGSGPAGIIGNRPPVFPPLNCLRISSSFWIRHKWHFAHSHFFYCTNIFGEAASKCATHPANLSVLLLEAGGPSYSCVGGTAHPDWLNGANISRVDCPGLYNSIFDTSEVPSTTSLLCNGVINALGGCTVGGSSAINAGLYFIPPDSDWDSWGIESWSSKNISQSAAALKANCGDGESITSTDGQYYLQSSYNAMSKWLAAAGYAEVNVNGQQNSKSKVSIPKARDIGCFVPISP